MGRLHSSNLLCFFSIFWKGILRLDAFYRITTFSVLESLNLVILWFIVGNILDLPPFLVLDF